MIVAQCVLYEQANEKGGGSGMKILNTIFIYPGKKKVKVHVLCTSMHMPSCLRGGQQWWCHMFNKGLYFNLESTLET